MKVLWLKIYLWLAIIAPAYGLDTISNAVEHKLDDTNTRISFEVDTTWHLVKGKTNGITGRLWRETPGDDASIRAEIKIPVASFDTDSESRDKELRSSMAAEQFPNVSLNVEQIDRACMPASLGSSESCAGQMTASLTIRDVRKELKLPYQLKKGPKGLEVSGSVAFEWLAFHVKDPSILIARVHKEVLVRYVCTIK